MIGMGCYMNPQIAALGLLLMGQFYNLDGTKRSNEDLRLPYPRLSNFYCYTQSSINPWQQFANSLREGIEAAYRQIGKPDDMSEGEVGHVYDMLSNTLALLDPDEKRGLK